MAYDLHINVGNPREDFMPMTALDQLNIWKMHNYITDFLADVVAEVSGQVEFPGDLYQTQQIIWNFLARLRLERLIWDYSINFDFVSESQFILYVDVLQNKASRPSEFQVLGNRKTNKYLDLPYSLARCLDNGL